MNFPSKETVMAVRAQYPAGARVELVMMRFFRKIRRWLRRERLTYAPQKVTPEAMARIIDTREPRGLFYRKEARRLYVGVDNTSGDSWTEVFRTKRQCLRWLRSPGLEPEDCGALGYGKK